eukprot:CAMPEP_0198209584 /NCGR_PEP_ID=MMETSP1445-20131203/17230_1 /TAXON_ID=36898 /ORGANISM="Pyramimonas sp., Strain CCMP2087" /LENGTH=73 /DNA_ID=CAMNT_0043883419 /DNA_START=89 /DNA_END=310 /DNA_ORIENTATION=+
MGVLHYVAAFVGVNTVAYSMYTVVTVNKTFGGTIPSTRNEEWAAATAEAFTAKVREAGGGPVYMNPITNGVKP